jgi:hypothetical protein
VLLLDACGDLVTVRHLIFSPFYCYRVLPGLF